MPAQPLSSPSRASSSSSRRTRARLGRAGIVAAGSCLAVTVLAAGSRTLVEPRWNLLSVQQEADLGRLVSSDAGRTLRMLTDARVDRYVNAIGRTLVAKAPGEPFAYRFGVMNDAAVDALAFPGGPVYISRGVFDSADTEAQIAGVLAHQIAHVALRHGTSQASHASAGELPVVFGGLARNSSGAGVFAALGAGFAADSVLFKYSPAVETEADILATQILFDAGFDPNGFAQFLEKVDITARQSGRAQAGFFVNHPSADRRIQRVTEEVRALGIIPRASRSNPQEYGETRRYVRTLPPAPTPRLVAPGRVSGADEPRRGDVRP